MNLKVSKIKRETVVLIWLLVTTILSAYGYLSPREIEYALTAAEIIEAIRQVPADELGELIVESINQLPIQEVAGVLEVVLNSSFSLLQKGYSYIISKVANYTCMQNGTTGALEWYSTSFSAIYEASVGNTTGSYGGSIFIKPGLHTVDFAPLTIRGGIAIEGVFGTPDQTEGTNLKLADGVNADMFLWEQDTREFSFCMRNIVLDGNKANNNAGSGLNISDALGEDLDDVRLENVGFLDFAEYGIATASSWGHYYYGLIIENCGSGGIIVSGGSKMKITASKINSNGGIGLTLGSIGGLVMGCSICYNDERGIWIAANWVQIIGNELFGNGLASEGSYDAIYNGAYDVCLITNNDIFGDYQGTLYTRNGIRIANSGALDCRIDSNIIDSTSSSAIYDGGTRTRINGYGRASPVYASEWDIGDVVEDTNNGTIWLKLYDGSMTQIGG